MTMQDSLKNFTELPFFLNEDLVSCSSCYEGAKWPSG